MGTSFRRAVSFTYNKTAVTFQVVGQPETYSFSVDSPWAWSKAALSGDATTLIGYAAFDGGENGISRTGVLNPGTYTFTIDLYTNDPDGAIARGFQLQRWDAKFAIATFSVTPEPASMAVVAFAGMVALRRHRRAAGLR